MNFLSFILAQAAAPVGPDGNPILIPEQSVPLSFFGELPINDLWRCIVNVSWMQAVVFLAFAAIYLVYGWRVFKALVVINFAALGLVAGQYVGGRLGSPLWGGIMGVFLMAMVTWPFMKYCVSILGALAGAILGGALWRTGMLPDPLMWCGALAGLIAGGFLAFSSFKFSIMLFTSLQGSVFLAIGVLALLNDYPDLGAHLAKAVYSHGFLLPSLVIVPTIVGILFQQKLLKQEENWAIPE